MNPTIPNGVYPEYAALIVPEYTLFAEMLKVVFRDLNTRLETLSLFLN